MNNNYGVLLTGATGLLGYQILKILISESADDIYLLIRPANLTRKKNLIRELLSSFNSVKLSNEKIKVVIGDITSNNLGLPQNEYKKLASLVRQIYHCAALTSFREGKESIRSVNIKGTHNILNLAKDCKNFVQLNYISSIFVAGTYKGIFNENNLVNGQKFNNYYEQSKYEAELLVGSSLKEEVRSFIFRPSVIIPHSYRFPLWRNSSMLYQLFNLLRLEIFEELPIYPKTYLNIISSENAARVIYSLSKFYSKNKGKLTCHILSRTSINLINLIKKFCEVIKCKRPDFITPEVFNFSKISKVQFKILHPFLPYFDLKANFKAESTFKMMTNLNLEIPEISEQEIINSYLGI